LREVDLSVNGIRSGTSYSDVLKILGRPSRVENAPPDDLCGIGPMRTLYYRGLTIELTRPRKMYVVVTMTVTSPRFRLNQGIRIGTSMKIARTKLGRGNGDTATKLYYVTKGNLGGVTFFFRNKKLLKVEMSETLC
jgi:hypothetical protein